VEHPPLKDGRRNVMYEIVGNHVECEPPKRPKKITGTRFASILGLDIWNTDFKTWCAITKTYEEPFIDNKYTIAGKVIEPKIIDYLNKVYFFGNLKSPTDIYGKDYFKKTWGNFFQDDVFGGMWDALYYENDKVKSVIEIKTTKRAEDWEYGAPDHYALQAALYAYLLGVEEVTMVGSFLEEKDYESPELFVPTIENTIIDEFNIYERFPHFQKHIERALDWWNKYVVTGISPDFDEKKDADILKVLRNTEVKLDDGELVELICMTERLESEIEKLSEPLKAKEKELKKYKEILKKIAIKNFKDTDKTVSIKGNNYEFITSKSERTDIDEEALKKDGLLEKYSKTNVSYRFSVKKLA
jgi:hypothetical protein